MLNERALGLTGAQLQRRQVQVAGRRGAPPISQLPSLARYPLPPATGPPPEQPQPGYGMQDGSQVSFGASSNDVRGGSLSNNYARPGGQQVIARA